MSLVSAPARCSYLEPHAKCSVPLADREDTGGVACGSSLVHIHAVAINFTRSFIYVTKIRTLTQPCPMVDCIRMLLSHHKFTACFRDQKGVKKKIVGTCEWKRWYKHSSQELTGIRKNKISTFAQFKQFYLLWKLTFNYVIVLSESFSLFIGQHFMWELPFVYSMLWTSTIPICVSLRNTYFYCLI